MTSKERFIEIYNKYITRDRRRKEDEVIEEQVAVVEKTWSPL